MIADIVSAISRLRETHGAEGLRGIGVGVPGFIRMKEGLITNSNNLPYLENVPIRDVLSAKLNTRVILENDANAAALGECWMGAGRDVDDLVLLTLGTGIGGGIISGGRIVRGSVGMAGETGPHLGGAEWQSLRVRKSGLSGEACLGHGSVRHGAPDATRRRSDLEGCLRAGEATRRGRRQGAKVWQVVGEALGMAMAALINTFNFPLYLLSGGMLPAWEYFAPHMMRVAMQRSFTFRATANETRIAQATLGNLAGLYGAAYLPWVEK